MRITHRFSISAAAFLIGLGALGLGASPVLAQTVNDNTTAASTTAVTAPDTLNSSAIDHMVDRDLSQEQRIENGLKDGQLTTAEGARLEHGEAQIDKMESNDLSNGSLSAQEAARLRRAQNDENRDITRLEDNGRTDAAGSNSVLAKDVQRDINQQQRIDNGIDNGSLTATEVGSLEGGQTRDDRAEFRAGHNNMITANEQQNIRGDENAQSTDIFNDRHNGTTSTVVSDDINNRDRDRVDHDQNRVDRDQDRDRFDRDRDRDRVDNDHDQGDRDHDRTTVADRDHDGKANDKGWGHWSWDRPHHGLDRDRDDQQAMIGANANGNVTANPSGQGQAVNVDSDDTAATTASTGASPSANGNTSTTEGSSTSVNSGSSTSMTAANSGSMGSAAAATPAVTPVHTAPVVTPHVSAPHVAVAHH